MVMGLLLACWLDGTPTAGDRLPAFRPGPADVTAEPPRHLYARRMSLELRHYRLFATVAELGSFSAAARELDMSQPSVSRAVAVIERRLGARLVERTTRTFALTRAGKTLHDEARRVLDAAAAAEARTRRVAEERTLVVAVKA